jgi:hypothetical protein
MSRRVAYIIVITTVHKLSDMKHFWFGNLQVNDDLKDKENDGLDKCRSTV